MASKKQGTKKDEGKSLKSKNTVKTIDQMTVARQIAEKFGFKLSDILAVIEEEQKLTMEYAKMGYKVISGKVSRKYFHERFYGKDDD